MEHDRVDTIQVLVPKEAVLTPVLCDVLWGGGVAREGTSRSGNYFPNSGPAQPFAPHYGFSFPPRNSTRWTDLHFHLNTGP